MPELTGREPMKPVEASPRRVRFNGVGDDGREMFLIRRDRAGFGNFRKTARKPYDAVVCACLIAFVRHFGRHVTVVSDGFNGPDLPEDAERDVGRSLCQAAVGCGSEYGVTRPGRLGRPKARRAGRDPMLPRPEPTGFEPALPR